MTAFSFKKEFAADVEEGRKRQTIRKDRKDGRPPCARGGALQLYTGMRTAECRKLRDAVCLDVRRIIIKKNGAIWTGGKKLGEKAAGKLARADRFSNVDKMRAWFADVHGLPFKGWVIRW